MSIFDALRNNTIIIRKTNGKVIEGIKATVSKSKITFDHQNILLEVDDLIEVVLSNGATDTYAVLDPNFHEAFSAIPAHYQADVRKLGVREAQSRIQTFTINMTGPNARLNSNSIDNSVNVAGDKNEIADLVAGLRSEVEQLDLENSNLTDALDLIRGIETQALQDTPNKPVLKALLGALPQSANIASIASAILAALTL